MLLESDRLLLRNFTSEDLSDLFEYGSQPNVWERGGNPTLHNIEQAGLILREWSAEERRLAIVWKENDKVVGHISVKDDSEEGRADTKELGFALNRDYHRRGIMSEAVGMVLKAVFSSDIRYIWACCFQDNTPSKQLIEKCGFEFIHEGSFYSPGMDKTFQTYEYCMTRSRFLAIAEHNGEKQGTK